MKKKKRTMKLGDNMYLDSTKIVVKVFCRDGETESEELHSLPDLAVQFLTTFSMSTTHWSTFVVKNKGVVPALPPLSY